MSTKWQMSNCWNIDIWCIGLLEVKYDERDDLPHKVFATVVELCWTRSLLVTHIQRRSYHLLLQSGVLLQNGTETWRMEHINKTLIGLDLHGVKLGWGYWADFLFFVIFPVFGVFFQNCQNNGNPWWRHQMGPTWGLPRSCRPQMGPMLAP